MNILNTVGRALFLQGRSARRSLASRDIDGGSRVIVLSQFYRPEPSRYPAHIAEALIAQGNDVRVITGFPNRPGGKLHAGYQQRFGFSEIINDVRVHRVPLIINHSESAVERIANYLSFAVNALALTSIVRKADVVYVYASPATAAIPAQIWERMLGVPYVVHVQDLWPESVTDSGMLTSGLAKKLAKILMAPWLKRLYGRAQALITISPGMQDLLRERGIEERAMSVIYNWAIESTIEVKSRESFNASSLSLLYAGNLGPMQDIGTIVEAARRFESNEAFNLSIAGGGVLASPVRESTVGMIRTKYLGLLSRPEIGKLYLQADFQLVTLKDLPIFRTTVPSKLQSSLASGVPVITTVQGDVAELLESYNAGLVAEPENVDSLVAVFSQALAMSADERSRMGKNARRLYLEHMSHAAGTDAVVSVVERVSRHNVR